MARLSQIFLIRHAESQGNVDQSVHLKMPDHAIGLSERGLEQAEEAGMFLAGWLNKEEADRITATYTGAVWNPPGKIRLWSSPYKRTRQTADGIARGLSLPPDLRGYPSVEENWLLDRAENILLCEQQFGLFDGVPDEELPIKFPTEHAHYKKCEDFEGRFWARMPMGESRFDVCQRVAQSFGSFQRDAERHGVERIAVVAHGVTNRAFRMMWMHHSWEWFEKEPNPNNCSISLIQLNPQTKKYEDRGCIFEGFARSK